MVFLFMPLDIMKHYLFQTILIFFINLVKLVSFIYNQKVQTNKITFGVVEKIKREKAWKIPTKLYLIFYHLTLLELCLFLTIVCLLLLLMSSMILFTADLAETGQVVALNCIQIYWIMDLYICAFIMHF